MPGIASGVMASVSREPEPGNGRRRNAKAAGVPMRRASGTTVPTSRSDVTSAPDQRPSTYRNRPSAPPAAAPSDLCPYQSAGARWEGSRRPPREETIDAEGEGRERDAERPRDRVVQERRQLRIDLERRDREAPRENERDAEGAHRGRERHGQRREQRRSGIRKRHVEEPRDRPGAQRTRRGVQLQRKVAERGLERHDGPWNLEIEIGEKETRQGERRAREELAPRQETRELRNGSDPPEHHDHEEAHEDARKRERERNRSPHEIATGETLPREDPRRHDRERDRDEGGRRRQSQRIDERRPVAPRREDLQKRVRRRERPGREARERPHDAQAEEDRERKGKQRSRRDGAVPAANGQSPGSRPARLSSARRPRPPYSRGRGRGPFCSPHREGTSSRARRAGCRPQPGGRTTSRTPPARGRRAASRSTSSSRRRAALPLRGPW